MDKTAQRRSRLNKLREFANIPKSYLDRYFQPELKAAMDKIIEADDTIRAELTGSKIGKAKAPEDKISAKQLIKDARSHFNRHEYMAGITALSHFRKKMILVIQAINTINVDSFGLDFDKIHHKYLFDEYAPESLDQLKQNVQLKAQEMTSAIIKEAGIFDMVHNVATSKGRSLSAWERQNQKATEKLRKGGFKLIDLAQDTLSGCIADLKGMAHFRSIRDPHEYARVAKNIVSQFAPAFDTAFTAYYTDIVMPIINKHEALTNQQAPQVAGGPVAVAPAATTVEPLQPRVGPPADVPEDIVVPPTSAPPAMPGDGLAPPPPQFTAELSAAPTKPVPVAPPAHAIPELVVPPHTPKHLVSPTGEISEDSVPKTVLDYVNKLNQSRKASFSDLANSLKILGSDDPLVLAHHIAKYAKSIQDEDLEMAVKLFGIVKQIRG